MSSAANRRRRLSSSSGSGDIGSDISVFFSEGAAYCTGRGEIVEDVELPIPLDTPMLLVKPDIGLSTPAIFKALDLDGRSTEDPLDLLERIKSEVQGRHMRQRSGGPRVRQAARAVETEGEAAGRGHEGRQLGVYERQREHHRAGWQRRRAGIRPGGRRAVQVAREADHAEARRVVQALGAVEEVIVSRASIDVVVMIIYTLCENA